MIPLCVHDPVNILQCETFTKRLEREQEVLKQDSILGESIDQLTKRDHKRGPPKTGGKRTEKPAPGTMPTRPPQPTCMKCGKGPHSKYVCPARAVTCRKCHKVGHYQEVCLNTRVRENPTEMNFLGAVGGSEQDTNPWMVSLKLNGKPAQLKIDTGADT